MDLRLATDIARSPRVQQVEGMFDVPPEERRTFSLSVDAPLDEREWQVGLIAGPSGSGKSSVARELFGDCMVDGYEWPTDGAVVDGFPEGTGIKEVVAALSSVGFSSPPAWTKPHHVLSTGERFRCDLARALVDPRETVAFDEFTSVVDRQVAQVGAHAVAKAVRKTSKRFVAITCHDDVEEWLQPDWVIEPHGESFRWRSQRRRPAVDLDIVRVSRDAWGWFAQHHYLDASIHRSSRCFAAMVGGRPVAFAAIIPQPHPRVRTAWRLHRLVVMPDWQGLGLGNALADVVSAAARAAGRVVYRTMAHPAVIRACAKSPAWQLRRHGVSQPKSGQSSITGFENAATRRRTASFRYVGPARPELRDLWDFKQPKAA